jgi:hypothetical protein
MAAAVVLQGLKRPPADFGVARLLVVTQLVMRGFVEGRQQIEGDVGRLVAPGIGAGDVMAERTQSGLARQRPGRFAGRQRGGVKARHQSRGNRFHVAFHARDLPGEEHLWARAQLQRGRQ